MRCSKALSDPGDETIPAAEDTSVQLLLEFWADDENVTPWQTGSSIFASAVEHAAMHSPKVE